MVMSVITKPDYVAWQEVLSKPRKNTIHITVKREQLIDAVKRVDRVNHIKRAPIIFNTIDGGLVVSVESGDRKAWTSVDALSTGGGKRGQGYPAIRSGMTIRRLTPTECERRNRRPAD